MVVHAVDMETLVSLLDSEYCKLVVRPLRCAKSQGLNWVPAL